MSDFSRLELKYDEVFSKWIRQKDADENGVVKCYTCTNYLHWKQIHCGHYVVRRHRGTRYYEKNCKPQCPSCNGLIDGNARVFAENLVKEYGFNVLNELFTLKNQTVNADRRNITEKINYYKSKLVWTN